MITATSLTGPAPKAASGVPGAGLKHELSPSPLPAARTLKRTASAENVAGEEVSRVASKEGADPRDLGKLQQPAGRVSRQMLLGCQPPRTEGSKFNSGLGENNGSAWQRAPDPKGAAALLAPACGGLLSRFIPLVQPSTRQRQPLHLGWRCTPASD